MIRVSCDWCGRELDPDEKAETLQLSHFPQGLQASTDMCRVCMDLFQDLLIRLRESQKASWKESQAHLSQVASPKARK